VSIPIPIILVIATIAIAFLCWSWMQSTRASQRRVDEQNRRMIELLERIAENTERNG
jgi:hypothetical protein